MFVYEKKLQYPVRIARPDPKMAARIISQYGGPDGELGASLRYLSQRYTMPCGELKGLLTDIGVEELGHLEIVGAMIQQLTRDLSCDDITKAGFDAYFVDHGAGVYPTSAAGHPYHAAGMQSKGDALTDLHENIAADAAIVQEQQGLQRGLKYEVGTSFLTHCSQMKEPPSALDCSRDNGQQKKDSSCCRIGTTTGGVMYGKEVQKGRRSGRDHRR